MIIVTKAFMKYVVHFSHDILNDILRLITRHAGGLKENLFMIEEYDTYMILKGYLDGKRVRLIVAKQDNIYIPLALYKKESREGFNIRSGIDVSTIILRSEKCIRSNEYETFSLK